MKKLTVNGVVYVSVVLRVTQELTRNGSGLCAVVEGGCMIVVWTFIILMLMDTLKGCVIRVKQLTVCVIVLMVLYILHFCMQQEIDT